MVPYWRIFKALAISPKAGRFITGEVLLIDGITEISDGPPEIPPRTQHAVIFQKDEDGKWRIAAIRLSAPAEERQ
jgi:hypothetical protein